MASHFIFLHFSPPTYSIMSEQRKAVIKNADMDEKMQQDAVDTASKALAEYNIEKVPSRLKTQISSVPIDNLLLLLITGRCSLHQEGV